MASSNDPHEVLGLDPGATHDERRKRYRELARRYHPDVNGGDPTATWMFKQINEAQSTIGEPAGSGKNEGGAEQRPAPEERPRHWEPETEARHDEVTATEVMAAAVATAAGSLATSWGARWSGLGATMSELSADGLSEEWSIAAAATATTITTVVVIAKRRATWKESGQWRPAFQAAEGVLLSAAAATLGGIAITALARLL